MILLLHKQDELYTKHWQIKKGNTIEFDLRNAFFPREIFG